MQLCASILFAFSLTASGFPSPGLSERAIISTGPTVNTTSGRITGYKHTKFNQTLKFLGIPFAKPPLGELRFAAPQAIQDKSKAIEAKHQPLSCLQPAVHLNYSWPTNFLNIEAAGASFANYSSEDCLYLDVYTTSTTPTTLKPVMVWIYGGGFHAGGISDSSQGGAIYAQENDVVFVKVNYRLGIFGFSGNPNGKQNVGLLDQRLALEWIRDNVKGFGGDPKRIMLYGHSAGGASVDYHSYAWKDDPIFQSATIMSGTTTSFGNRFPNTTAAGWQETAKILGCQMTSLETIESCLISKPAEEVLNASLNATKLVLSALDSTAQLYGSITGVFGPTIDNVTIFENYTVLGLQGQFAKTPYLIGSADGEGCYFVQAGTAPANDSSAITEAVFSCPIYHQAAFRAAQGLKTWKYFYGGSYPNVNFPVCPGQAWHGQENYVMFQSASHASQQPDSQSELDQGAYMRKIWSDFAKDPKNVLCSSEIKWPTVAQDPCSTNALGFNDVLHTVDGNITQLNAPCLTRYRYGAPNF